MRKGIMLSLMGAMVIAGSALAASADWSSIVSDYEKITDQVIAVYAKVKAGDMNAAQELSALTPKYQELSTRLASAKPGDLTPDQVKKFQDLALKYQKAMAP